MIAFPNCKINLGLSIVAKRPDGYHELETVFYPVALTDIVEVIHSNDPSTPIQFTNTGLNVPGNLDQNLCVKAYEILKKDFPSLPNVKIHLHKHIPMGAGLGGGSSDATAVLKIVNQLFNLNLNNDKLVDYAAQLGSDCAFFVYDKAYHATGRGEILQPFQCDLSNYQIVLIHPGIHVSTTWAFGQLTPSTKQKSIAEIVAQPIETWKAHLINDFEPAIIQAHPTIGALKNLLYQKGAIYASMSGSGSSLFGIFPKGQALSHSLFTAQYRVDIV
jgi:4-diphosphocytidyl-2-C-methyl-D-erythritol kinase